MQEEENKKDVPMVDIDTSGPGAEMNSRKRNQKVKLKL